MESGDGFLAGFGLQVSQGDFAVHKSVLGQDACCICVLEDVEGGFQVGVAVGVVGAEFVAGEVLSGGFVQAGGQLVGEAVAVVGIATPAGGVMPFLAVSCDVFSGDSR